MCSSSLQPHHDGCLAYDRHAQVMCARAPTSSESKWCAFHEEMQAKLLKSYKRRTHTIEVFCQQAALPELLQTVEEEDDLDQLREWNENTRIKGGLTRRAMAARLEHHRTFYRGGDSGHSKFIESLRVETEKLEEMLVVLNQRAYTVSLQKSKAEWILSTQRDPMICEEDPTDLPLESLPPSPPTSESSFPRSPKRNSKKGSKKSRRESDADCPCCPPAPAGLSTQEKLIRLRQYFRPPPGLLPSVTIATWENFFSNIFRYVVLRIPSLATLALAPFEGSISEFLDAMEVRAKDNNGEEVDLLWSARKFATSSRVELGSGMLSVGVLAEAIADTFRVETELDDDCVELLGGKVFKSRTKQPLSNDGWDLLYSLVGCYGCSLPVTSTFIEWIRNRRLAVLGVYPDWLSGGESRPHHIFRAAGIVACADNSTSCSKSITRVASKGGKKTTVLVENWERGWLFCKLARDDPSTSLLVDALMSSEKVIVLSRDVRAQVTTAHPKIATLSSRKPCSCHCHPGEEIWLTRVRSGLTPAQRRSANWTASTHLVGHGMALESFSRNYSPERRYGRQFEDVVDLLIFDNRSDQEPHDWHSFSEIVAKHVLQSRGCASWEELVEGQTMTGVVRHDCPGNARAIFREQD